MMIMAWLIAKLTYFLSYSIGIDIVSFCPLMVAVFTFLSIYICYDHVLEGNRCNVNYGYDDHKYEGLVFSLQF